MNFFLPRCLFLSTFSKFPVRPVYVGFVFRTVEHLGKETLLKENTRSVVETFLSGNNSFNT